MRPPVTSGVPVVLKILKPANRAFPEVADQWQRELRLSQKVRHPQVVAIHNAFVCNNLFYIVLERAWSSLSDLVSFSGSLPPQLVHSIATQILHGLAHVHALGVLHRDLSIHNVLVFNGQKYIFKISDFGISKEFLLPFEPKISTTKTAQPWLVPPELLQHGFTNERSDLYQVGLLLLFALRGRLPFSEAMNQQQVAAAIVSGVPRQMAEQIGTPLGDFIATLLRRRQQYRLPSAVGALESLRSVA